MEEIKCPLFLFDNVPEQNDKYKLGGSMEGMYNSIESLEISLEPWQINANSYKVYDAQGKLLTLTTEWRKITEKDVFGKCLVNREFININLSDNPIIQADALKKFLQCNLSDTINYIKYTLEKSDLNQYKLNIKTNLFWDTQKVIKDEFINLVFVNDKVIHVRFEFLKQLMLDFVNNLLKNDLIYNMELIDLAKLAGQLWVCNAQGNGTCIENQF